MLRLNFLFLLCFLRFIVAAHTYTGHDADKRIKGSDFIITDDNDIVKYVRLSKNYNVEEKNHKAWLVQILNLPRNFELQLKRTETDKIGFTHYRYVLFYNEFPVECAVYYVHISAQQVISANGELFPAGSISINIHIPETAAFNYAKEHISAEHYLWEKRGINNRPYPEMVIVYKEGQYRLSYKYDIYAIKPLSRNYIYIDAETGKIIKVANRIHYSDTPGIAETMYQGTKDIIADSYSGYYRLRESGRGGGIQTYDLNNDIDYYYAVDFTDTDNYWNTTANFDNAAYDAHFGTEMTYDYYYNNFARNSYDNAGAPLLSYVHYDYGFVNAFWDGTCMTYGDGDDSLTTPFTSIEIVAHEITHGVTEYSANLEYAYESGALNESFSDIFGICVDFYTNAGTANFLMGELIHTDGTPFRNMSNPNECQNPDTYLGDFWDPAEEVHCNSGVMNFWFYLLCSGGSGVNDNGDNYNVTAIGINAAAQIAYRTLTVYLTPYSQYSDARIYSIQAAIDLFGECSDEAINVTNAWYAVGVGGLFNNAVIAQFSASQTFACQLPANIIFTNQCLNGTSFYWDFGDGSTSTVGNPAHTYSSVGNYTVSLIANGSALCGNTDTIIKSGYITVTNTGGPIAASCTPEAPISANGIGIYNVSFNTINNSSGDGAEGYQDFTCSNVTTVMEGKKYYISVTTGPSQYEDVFAWIDLNNDGLFNNQNEFVFFSDNKLVNHSDSIIIPNTNIYDSLLRMRIASDFASNPIDSACTSPSYGQYEDYSVVLLENISPPAANFTSDKQIANINEPVHFSDQTLNLPDAWLWLFPGGTPSSSTGQNPTIIYANTGVYDVSLIVSNIYGADTLTITGYLHITNTYFMCQSSGSSETAGLLYDSGGPTGDYMNNEYCQFLIDINCAMAITLSFSEFETESGFDYFTVYDGTSTAGQLLLNISGYSIPAPVTSTSGAMFIEFSTDGFVTGQGFIASWLAQIPSPVPVVAEFTISDSNPPFGTDITFTDLSSNDPISWFWNFGDGNTSTVQNPVHAYYTPETFNVTLIVQNCYGADTVSHSLTVQEAPSISVEPYSYNITLNIRIYPNPNHGKFMIQFNGFNNETVGILLTDLLGQVIYSEKFTVISETGRSDLTRFDIDISRYSPGVYLLLIRSMDGKIIREAIIRK
ncbi:MAG: M4 family metallopeptidase [Bacteroidia bacterium]|nr:M4 family metallopeptidase [Bacteroidia bacterium]